MSPNSSQRSGTRSGQRYAPTDSTPGGGNQPATALPGNGQSQDGTPAGGGVGSRAFADVVSGGRGRPTGQRADSDGRPAGAAQGDGQIARDARDSRDAAEIAEDSPPGWVHKLLENMSDFSERIAQLEKGGVAGGCSSEKDRRGDAGKNNSGKPDDGAAGKARDAANGEKYSGLRRDEGGTGRAVDLTSEPSDGGHGGLMYVPNDPENPHAKALYKGGDTYLRPQCYDMHGDPTNDALKKKPNGSLYRAYRTVEPALRYLWNIQVHLEQTIELFEATGDLDSFGTGAPISRKFLYFRRAAQSAASLSTAGRGRARHGLGARA
jgi:hypothetical protein